MTEARNPPARPYASAIADLVGSRDLPDRLSAQERLRAAIHEVNDELGDSLAAPLRLTGGDEWKVLLAQPAAVVEVIDRMADELHPVEIRWGVGWGRLDTALAAEVGALDGPTFHRAREAVRAAAKTGAWVRTAGFSPLDDTVLSALFGALGALRASWTERQVDYVRGVRGRTQAEAAREVGVTQSGISKGLGRAHYSEYREGIEALRALLATYGPGEEG